VTPKRPASSGKLPGPRIYTRTGDSGETGLIGGHRVLKDHPRVEAYGAVDELNAHLGAVRVQMEDAQVDALISQIQHRLFDLGAELATPAGAATRASAVDDTDVADLERAIDMHQATLTPLREFILPGGAQVAATLHVARTVCRRAERRLVALAQNEPVRGELLRYLNRLSDLLFVLARVANQRAGRADVTWQPKQSS
jgi:cob(I)alamin adenosyltransferase